MPSSPAARSTPRPRFALPTLRVRSWSRADLSAPARRLAHFWVVWTMLLLVHEGGHAVSAWQQGLSVSRVTVGAGPVLWRGTRGPTEIVLRLVPLAGVTTIGPVRATGRSAPAASTGWNAWSRQIITLVGGVAATLLLALGIAGLVAARERSTARRWTWGRILVADAVVLTVFNLLPVPPLDGGRALLGTIAALRGAPLSSGALFWVQLGGLALAVAPMTLWTRWTARIDAVVMRWGAPPAP